MQVISSIIMWDETLIFFLKCFFCASCRFKHNGTSGNWRHMRGEMGDLQNCVVGGLKSEKFTPHCVRVSEECTKETFIGTLVVS